MQPPSPLQDVLVEALLGQLPLLSAGAGVLQQPRQRTAQGAAAAGYQNTPGITWRSQMRKRKPPLCTAVTLTLNSTTEPAVRVAAGSTQRQVKKVCCASGSYVALQTR